MPKTFLNQCKIVRVGCVDPALLLERQGRDPVPVKRPSVRVCAVCYQSIPVLLQIIFNAVKAVKQIVHDIAIHANKIDLRPTVRVVIVVAERCCMLAHTQLLR